ncbi:MAG TPA: rhomboid family intramembrane serine protease [Gaiellaceae bacterium]|nr:rhomboid family intramembrane serine protease [Gaiellaceae bacterium]
MASTEQAMVCYRHPGRETLVSCSNCDRPICTDCMVQTAVGIKCPECAGQPTGVARAARSAGRAVGEGAGARVTKALIAVNVGIFLLQYATGSGRPLESELFERGALYGPLVADGEWWRLVTAGFLHASVIHIAFNMLMLWWFGSALEGLLGRGRFLAVYGLGLLTGSAGALLLSPEAATVGASGAVFAVLGAGLVLERRGINVFGGAALTVVLLNVAITLFVPNISLGGHLGGLAGGILVILALMHFSRSHPAYSKIDVTTVASLLAIGVGALLLSYLRVRGYA